MITEQLRIAANLELTKSIMTTAWCSLCKLCFLYDAFAIYQLFGLVADKLQHWGSKQNVKK